MPRSFHDDDSRLAALLMAALKEQAGLNVGVNESYSPVDRVYFTHELHAGPRGLACAMIEILSDGIGDGAGQRRWTGLIGSVLLGLNPGDEGIAAAGSGPAGSRQN